MEVGLSDKLSIGAIIQARMKSERLPGKILLPIPFHRGKPLLKWIVDSIRLSKILKKIVLASSASEENDTLEQFALANSVDLFRGDEDDVLSRFISVSRTYNFDVVVRLTGDNPIVDTTILDQVVLTHIEHDNDYTQTTGLPLGMNFEVVSTRALYQLEKMNVTREDREHVTLFIRNNLGFKKEQVTNFGHSGLERLRVTIDYPSDFAALSFMLDLLKPGVQPDINLVFEVLRDYAWIFDINNSNIQKKTFLTLSEEIEAAAVMLKRLDFENAARLLHERDWTSKKDQ